MNSVEKTFTMSDDTFNKLKYQIKTGRLSDRMSAYTILYVPFSLMVFICIAVYESSQPIKIGNPLTTFESTIIIIIFLLFTSLPFYITEKKVRADRMKKGLPINDDIVEILKQREVDERVMMEVKAHEKVSPSKDLNYYFELLQKGAITQEEYDAKKQQFL
jgi:hypothetical protein